MKKVELSPEAGGDLLKLPVYAPLRILWSLGGANEVPTRL